MDGRTRFPRSTAGIRGLSRSSLALWLLLALLAQGVLAVSPAPDAADRGRLAPRAPEAVLWTQPLSASNEDVYSSQDYELRLDAFDIVLADDFANTEPWDIDAISIPGDTYDTGCDLSCADRFTWEIYADAGGQPAGDPWGGGDPPQWSASLTPGNPQVSLSAGPSGWLSEVRLDLNQPARLPPGTWWLAFYPSLNVGACGCEYGRHVADTDNGHPAQVLNPGGGFGFPATWTSIQDASTWELQEQDLAFELEGVVLRSLGDRVWYDTDQDGLQDPGEPGVPGVRVDLHDNGDCTGLSMAQDFTDPIGAYSFADLRPGTYCLKFLNIPAGWSISPQDQGTDDALDSDADPVTRQIRDIQLTVDDAGQDLGLYLQGSLGDTVWCDADLNSTYEAGEGLSGVTVSLYHDGNCDGTSEGLVGTQDTVGDGHYLFSGLSVGPAGSPVCYVAVVDTGDVGGCSLSITPTRYEVALDVGDPDHLEADFGFTWVYDLGDRVWYDTDRDGLQESGEPGVGDIGVELYANGACTGDPTRTTTTDASGVYSFPGLAPGTYCLHFDDVPDGWSVSPPDQGADDAVDSDADPASLRIRDIDFAADDLNQDLGLYAPGSTGDTVWCDADRNRLYNAGEGVAGVTVSLYRDVGCDGVADAMVASQDTVGDGRYLFDDLLTGPPGDPQCYVSTVDVSDMGYCSDPFTPTVHRVVLDADGPHDLEGDFGFAWRLELGDRVWYDTDQDGRQDPGEPGQPDVVASLYGNGACQGPALRSTTSDASGQYLFPELAPGTYCLRFSAIPDGWSISPQDQGADDAVDSDADPATGETPAITLTDENVDTDLGVYAPGSVGDTVWCDGDRDGLIGPEEGVAGVMVSLYEDPSCTGAAGAVLDIQATVAAGHYLFDGLRTGPAGSPLCYLSAVYTAGLGECHLPLTPLTYTLALDAATPDYLEADFAFQPPWYIYLPRVMKGP